MCSLLINLVVKLRIRMALSHCPLHTKLCLQVEKKNSNKLSLNSCHGTFKKQCEVFPTDGCHSQVDISKLMNEMKQMDR